MTEKTVETEQVESKKVKAETDNVAKLQRLLEKALAERYKLGAGVKREGNEIIVPPFMTLSDAAASITRYETEMEEIEDTEIELHGHPYECAYAFYRAMNNIYGALVSFGSYSWFSMSHPKSLMVPINNRESVKVPIGRVGIPGLPISMTISISDAEVWRVGEVGALITFQNKRMYSPMIQEIETTTRRFLDEESLFKGKAIDSAYRFLNLGTFKPEKVIYSEDQYRQLDANLFTMIKNSDRAIAANIPLKRGILLHGSYGTGKTLTGLFVADLCNQHNWTFILVKPKDKIDAAILLAQRLQPACVFFEDIDSAVGEERDGDVNSILNTIDGLLSKDSKVITVLTTNHIEKINPAMLRPGRLDAVIELGTLDKPAVIKFIKESATDNQGNVMLEGELDEDAIFKAAEGYVPAFLKEAVSKAALYAIARDDGDQYLSTEDIVAALVELRPQYNLMIGHHTEKKVTLEDVIEGVVEKAAEHKVEETIPNLRLANMKKEEVSGYRIIETEEKKK